MHTDPKVIISNKTEMKLYGGRWSKVWTSNNGSIWDVMYNMTIVDTATVHLKVAKKDLKRWDENHNKKKLLFCICKRWYMLTYCNIC